MWFRKNKIKEEKSSVVKDTDDFLEKYKQSRKEIVHMQSQYQDYILRSLELDFIDYKENIEKNWPNFESNTCEFWNLAKSSRSSELKLIKSNNGDSIKIEVEFNFDESKLTFNITKLLSIMGYEYTNLKKEIFENIIFKYYMCYLYKKTNLVRDETKVNFQRMLDIIGKSTKRDAMINKILNG